MHYVIDILEELLRKERVILYTHSLYIADLNNGIDIVTREAFKESIRLAEERIPQLEKALLKLKEKDVDVYNNPKTSMTDIRGIIPRQHSHEKKVDYSEPETISDYLKANKKTSKK